MSIYEVLFWFLTIMAISCALGVILSRNPINSVLFLIATFFAVSGHYLLMNAQFLAIVNIIVYAGAIMVLFLFVIMLMNLNAEAEPVKNVYMKMAGIISGLSLMIVLVAALSSSATQNTVMRAGTNIGLIENLGKALFTQYVVPFEIASVLFLSAMVGAIVIGKKDPVKKRVI